MVVAAGGGTSDALRPLLEVIVCNGVDARHAEQGGADRLELVGSMMDDGLAPSVESVQHVLAVTSLPVRVMLRWGPGFGATHGEIATFRERAQAFSDLGVDGFVLGFLDDAGAVDVEAVRAVGLDGARPMTFHRAIDHAVDQAAAWSTIRSLPGVDQVLTAGDPDGLRFGWPTVRARATDDPWTRRVLVAGGGLAPAFVRPLLGAGVRRFHVGSTVRPGGSWTAPVSVDLVRQWRTLLDEEDARI